MRTMKLAPSVFGAGIGNLSQQLKILEENNVELLHVDVMDGHFVEKCIWSRSYQNVKRTHNNSSGCTFDD